MSCKWKSVHRPELYISVCKGFINFCLFYYNLPLAPPVPTYQDQIGEWEFFINTIKNIARLNNLPSFRCATLLKCGTSG